MRYEVSMMGRADWRIGSIPGALFTTAVDSADEARAILAAQERRRRSRPDRFPGGKPGTANIDPTWQYCLPDELVPMGRPLAKTLGARFFVGRPCKHHPLNHIRYTANRCCAICQAETVKGLKR